jgi:hypothetical protein
MHALALLSTQDRHHNQKKVQRARQNANHQAGDGVGLEFVQYDCHDIGQQGQRRRYKCEHSCKECKWRASSGRMTIIIANTSHGRIESASPIFPIVALFSFCIGMALYHKYL